MKPRLTLYIHGATDSDRTAHLRSALRHHRYSDVGYEWHKGEPLYHGDPTAGFFARQGVVFEQVEKD